MDQNILQPSAVIEGNRPPADWPSQGHILFTDYATKYRDGLDMVLKGITCDIQPGEKVWKYEMFIVLSTSTNCL